MSICRFRSRRGVRSESRWTYPCSLGAVPIMICLIILLASRIMHYYLTRRITYVKCRSVVRSCHAKGLALSMQLHAWQPSIADKMLRLHSLVVRGAATGRSRNEESCHETFVILSDICVSSLTIVYVHHDVVNCLSLGGGAYRVPHCFTRKSPYPGT
jgi:hypothetical protein